MNWMTPLTGRWVALALATTTAALLLVLLPGPAVSGTSSYVVTKTDDTSDGACNADCSLREAIIANNANARDEIIVPAGTYRLTIEGAGEDSGATGDLDVRRGTSIRGAGPRKTVVDARGIDRVLHTPFLGTETPFFLNIRGMSLVRGEAGIPPGGGIYHEAWGATLNLRETSVRNNAAGTGAGITVGNPSGFPAYMTAHESTVSDNAAAGEGGGIQLLQGELEAVNVTVSNNSAGNYGGGLRLFDGDAYLQNVTVAQNRALQSAGGVAVEGPAAAFVNTIVADNAVRRAGAEENCNAPVPTSLGNNLENGTSCGFDRASDVRGNPRLGDLRDNGGGTDTHALGRRSKATNAGGSPFPATDQRGVARPQRGASDIGAYEKD